MTRLTDLMSDLLDCIDDALEVPVCRSFIYPGPGAPHDTCQSTGAGNGQAWVANTLTLAGWPGPDGLPTTCATPLNETVEVGIVRCQRSVVNDDGTPPDPDLITEDAQQQQDDKEALRRAILCCWGIEGRDVIIIDWEPIQPRGGCVGGTWTVQIRTDGCGCSPES